MYLTPPKDHELIYIDIETDDLDATTIWCAVTYEFATKQTHRLIGHDDLCGYIQAHPTAIWCGHNALSFDVPTCNRLLGTRIPTTRVLDTLVLSYLYHPGLPGGHSLAAWAQRFGLKKGDYNDFTQFTDAMLNYCELDVRLGVRLYMEITKRLKSLGYSERSCKLEHDIRHVVNKQQRNGWWFDTEAAHTLLRDLRQQQGRLERQVHELFPPRLEVCATYAYRTKQDGTPYASYTRHLDKYAKVSEVKLDGTYDCYDWETFNLGSPKQRLDRLLSLGFVPTKKTKNGGPSVDEDSLVAFAKSSGDARIQALADYLVVYGRANMVESWIGEVKSDHRIHGRVFTCGANSRRMTHNTPNTANIPSNEARYGKESRSLWSVPSGNKRVVVGYDAKAVQMRMFAHFLPDPKLGERYWNLDVDADPHATNAKLIGIERKPVKNVFYANLFGAYPPKLATTAGRVGSREALEEYGTWIRDELYRVTPGLREATEAAQAEWRRNKGRLRCVDGGYVVCKSEQAALNYKIQPAEAVLMKTAAVMIDRQLVKNGWDVLKIGDIHDEGQLEAPEAIADTVGQLAVQCIRDAGEELGFRVPMDGDYKVGKSWAETH